MLMRLLSRSVYGTDGETADAAKILTRVGMTFDPSSGLGVTPPAKALFELLGHAKMLFEVRKRRRSPAFQVAIVAGF